MCVSLPRCRHREKNTLVERKLTETATGQHRISPSSADWNSAGALTMATRASSEIQPCCFQQLWLPLKASRGVFPVGPTFINMIHHLLSLGALVDTSNGAFPAGLPFWGLRRRQVWLTLGLLSVHLHHLPRQGPGAGPLFGFVLKGTWMESAPFTL